MNDNELADKAQREDDEITQQLEAVAVFLALIMDGFWIRINAAPLTHGVLATEWNAMMGRVEVVMGDMIAQAQVSAYSRSLAQAAAAMGDPSIVRTGVLSMGALERIDLAAGRRARLVLADMDVASRDARNRLLNTAYPTDEDFKAAVAGELETLGLGKKKVPGGIFWTLANTYAALAYAEGLAMADALPAIRDGLWGYTYSDLGDAKVRPEHRLMNGMTQPKEWEGWKHYTPPVFWNCRCFRVRRWKRENPQIVEARGYPPASELFNP